MYEVINAQYPGEHDIRGVKDGLKRGRNKMTAMEFHSLYGHTPPKNKQ